MKLTVKVGSNAVIIETDHFLKDEQAFALESFVTSLTGRYVIGDPEFNGAGTAITYWLETEGETV